MIPYSYEMVDMGGIDLAEANGTTVEGLYDRIIEAMNACGDAILYNWKFAGIEVPPSNVSSLSLEGSILINGMIQVTELNVVTVLGIAPPPPPILPVEPLIVTENGVYTAQLPASGFSPVTVQVPSGSAAVVHYYVGDELLREILVKKGDSLPAFCTFYNQQFYAYPSISSVDGDLDIQLSQVQTNFYVRQIYLVEYELSLEDSSLTITPTSVTGMQGRYGIVMAALEEVAPIFIASSQNKQYGRCNSSGTMPSILNSGGNRIWYSQYRNNTEVIMDYVSGQDYFIEVDMSGYIKILNFVKEE